MAVTNRGQIRFLKIALRNTSVPTNFYLVLVTSAVVPTRATNTMAELTEIAAGNGYTAGGYSINRDATDWDTLTENDSDNTSTVLLKDVVWTASGGTLPVSGSGAAYAVLTDDNGTFNSREVLAYHSLGGDVIVSSGQPLTITDFGFVYTEGT
jgi:hypothetical protein